MIRPLYALLQRPEHARIPFTLGRYRDNTVLVKLTVIGARIELDVFEDGHMGVSQFTVTRTSKVLALVQEIIDSNSDPAR